MKKLYTLFTVFLTGTLLVANDAVLTFENHALLANKENAMKIARYVDPGESGKNQVWDLTGMKRIQDFKGEVEYSYLTDTKNNFPESNVVLMESGNKFYMKLDQNELKCYGMENKNGDVVIHYDQPYVKMKYPFAYGDFISGKYSGMYKNLKNEIPIEGTYQVEADGYGKVLLPDGLEVSNALRVKTSLRYTCHFETRTSDVETTTYRWYTQEERFPIAVLIISKTSTNNKSFTSHQAAYKDRFTRSVTGIESAAMTIMNAKVYPNPVKDHFSVDYNVEKDEKVLIELYDNAGKLVSTLVNKKLQAGGYTFRFNEEAKALKQGAYYVKFTFGRQSVTRGLIKQ